MASVHMKMACSKVKDPEVAAEELMRVLGGVEPKLAVLCGFSVNSTLTAVAFGSRS
jgi:hypothetical protein